MGSPTVSDHNNNNNNNNNNPSLNAVGLARSLQPRTRGDRPVTDSNDESNGFNNLRLTVAKNARPLSQRERQQVARACAEILWNNWVRSGGLEDLRAKARTSREAG